VPAPALLLALTCAAGAAPGATAAAPRDVAWVWPAGDLPAPAPGEAAVLVRSVLLGDGPPRIVPRRRALVPGPGCRVTPVVHVHPGPDARALPPRDAAAVLEELLRAAAESTSGWVQLDFEAPAPLRRDWRTLVGEARRRLPPAVRLSVTAPASWCAGGAWLDALAADEVVPMFFHMGARGEEWLGLAATAPERLHPRCRAGAAGFSAQAPAPAALRRRYARRYWFHERGALPWTLPSTDGEP
jgi:hypothetical protein